jgi:hypothetical protein
MDRLEVLQTAAGLHAIHDLDENQAVREKIKAAVHEWPQDLIIETLLDGAEGAVTRPSDDHDKVAVYGLAFLLNNANALANGMAQNLPDSDALDSARIISILDDLIETNRDHFGRWGLGHLLP